MKKILLLALLLTSLQGTACDVCGCSLGGNYYGILPQFNRNFVGVRYSTASFRAHMHHSTGIFTDEYSHDTYSKIELLSRFYIGKKFQLFTFIPYSINFMNGTEQVLYSAGPGDLTLLGNFMLINTADAKEKKFRQTWLVGGGIKLPTGKFNLRDQGLLVNRNFQLGTGSTDFLLSTIYTVRYQKWGLNSEAGVKLNTRNQDDYIFGNQLHVSTAVFYWQNVRSWQFLPNVGMYYETASHHREGDFIQVNTGGSLWLGTFGLETYFRNFSLGLVLKQPIKQNFNSESGVEIKGQTRWSASLTYNF